ncbi:MAG: 16S rRNA (cytidine(1402)-2'-O)-methyltransferase [Sporolactobacillus sp.]
MMWEQKSFQAETNKGTLYLVPTPIGNLDDMTFRALDVLKQADILAAEDTRHTLKLCTHFDIHVPLWSYHEHNKKTSGAKLLAALEEGKTVALVTDAGTPGISDPGADLAAACAQQQIAVVPLPGANAALSALIASGLGTDHFLFYGFLPRIKKEQEQVLHDLSRISCSLIFYESPFRIKETLLHIKKVIGDRQISLSRELTKRYETIVRGTTGEVLTYLEQLDQIKGEICLVVAGADPEAPGSEETAPWWSDLTLIEHVERYIDEQSIPAKEAIKQAALDRKLPKREVYQAYHHLDPK